MNVNTTSDDLTIKQFDAPKQIKLFISLQAAKISGRLTFTDPSLLTQWHIYIYQGAVVYATGGCHPMRRWQRNLISNLPQIPFQLSHLQQQLTKSQADLSDNIWEYKQLSHWVKKQIITPQQGRNALLFALKEVFFDLTQTQHLICRLNQDRVLLPQLETIEPKDLIQFTQFLWQDWQDLGIINKSPNLAPIIIQPQQLQEKTSISAYQSLCKLFNSNRTIRDLAVQLRTSPILVIRSLLPYIQLEIFGLVIVPDLLEIELFKASNPNYNQQHRPLIACIDDSVMVSQMIEQIINLAGYRFIAINDPLQAVSTLIAHQPDLILMDIVMPRINGYDLCAQLRRHPEFTTTPIIFLTTNNGLVDRLRAKLVGSSDFIKKTVDPDELLHKITAHLA